MPPTSPDPRDVVGPPNPVSPVEWQLALLRLIGCGGASEPRRALLEQFPDPVAALDAGASAWRANGLSMAQASALRGPLDPVIGRALAWLAEPGHHLLGWHDPDYPPLLRRIPSPPLALFVAGEPALLWHPAVAIVGSRAATPAGRENAAAFTRTLVASGLAVTSGMAAGIDTVVHETALGAGGGTVAVLGTGPDMPYPRGNAGLHARIAELGAVVSEHLPGTPARAEHFPRRNRIIAGLSLATVVIEAAHRSGALITARLASEAGRDVFAVPGSIHNPQARGCHRLIRDGAGLVESAEEVIAALAPLAAELAQGLRARLGAPNSGDQRDGRESPPRPKPVQTAFSLGDTHRDPNHQNLWNALGHDPTAMDQLVERTALTPAVLSSMLLLMELDGRVGTQHGRYFRNR